mgnify:CR=1 FL=1
MPYNIPFTEKIRLSKKMLEEIRGSENPNLLAIVNYNLAMAYFGNKEYSNAIKTIYKDVYKYNSVFAIGSDYFN